MSTVEMRELEAILVERRHALTAFATAAGVALAAMVALAITVAVGG
jgi:hypothetical protein